jgi:hypothetical protein
LAKEIMGQCPFLCFILYLHCLLLVCFHRGS